MNGFQEKKRKRKILNNDNNNNVIQPEMDCVCAHTMRLSVPYVLLLHYFQIDGRLLTLPLIKSTYCTSSKQKKKKKHYQCNSIVRLCPFRHVRHDVAHWTFANAWWDQPNSVDSISVSVTKSIKISNHSFPKEISRGNVVMAAGDRC